jgi:hypothetical protein
MTRRSVSLREGVACRPVGQRPTRRRSVAERPRNGYSGINAKRPVRKPNADDQVRAGVLQSRGRRCYRRHSPPPEDAMSDERFNAIEKTLDAHTKTLDGLLELAFKQHLRSQ